MGAHPVLDPFPSLFAAYDERQPKMIEMAGHTDELLRDQNEIRLAVQRDVATAAMSRFAPLAWAGGRERRDSAQL